MKKLKPEIYISRRDLEQQSFDRSQDSAEVLPLLLVYILVATSLLILLLPDTDIEVPKIKINTERSSLVLFYANILLLVNSLLSGGIAIISDADILEAVRRVPNSQIVTDVSFHSTSSLSLTNLD